MIDPKDKFLIKIGGQFITGFPPEYYGQYILGVYASSHHEAWMKARVALDMPRLEPIVHRIDDMDDRAEMKRLGITPAFPN